MPGTSLESTTRTKAFGVGTKSDGRRIFDIAEVWERNGEVSLAVVKLHHSTGVEVGGGEGKGAKTGTHDIVRVCVLDDDTLGRQLRRERVGPNAEEGLAARIDGEHGRRRRAGEGAHVQDQTLFADKPVCEQRAAMGEW